MIFLTFKTCGVLEDGMLAPKRVAAEGWRFGTGQAKGAKDAESEHDLQRCLFVSAIIKNSSDSALRQAPHFGGEFF